MNHTPYSEMTLDEILLLDDNSRIFPLLSNQQQDDIIARLINPTSHNRSFGFDGFNHSR
ncbi:MAG: hypothetical protein IH626_21010 [Rhodospirillales bacterium]|nr:hypothetical protein [Rhodospirillales bacterium]